MLPSHRFPPSNLRHVPRPQGSRINRSVMFPGHRVPESTDVMFPGHRVPESIISYVPSLQGSRIQLMSCSQATVFQNPIFSYVPRPQGSRILSCHVRRPQGSRIHTQLCSQATGFQNKTSVIFPVHRVPEPSLSQVPRAQVSTI